MKYKEEIVKLKQYISILTLLVMEICREIIPNKEKRNNIMNKIYTIQQKIEKPDSEKANENNGIEDKEKDQDLNNKNNMEKPNNQILVKDKQENPTSKKRVKFTGELL